jgi:zinc protease
MKTFVARIAAVALLAASLAAQAQDAARQAPPLPTAPRPFTLPTPTTLSLPNGVKATFIDFGTVPKVTVSISVRVGALNDGDRTWLSDVTAELMKEGTTSKTAEQISDAAAAMGGELGIGVGADQTSLSLDVLSEYAPDAVALLAEVLTRPKLPAEELPRIQQNFLRNLSVALSSPQSQADAAFSALLFPDHPYGRVFPTAKQLQSYTIADIQKFYDSNFGAQRTRIYVAGKFDHKSVEAAVRQHLGDWKEGPAVESLPPPPAGAAVTKVLDRRGAPQSTFRVGLRVIDPSQPNFMPLSVANTVLGGTLTSRITMNLREDKGWAYSPGSSLGTFYRQGTWSEDADVKAESTGPALVEIYKEIARLQTTPPTAAELTATKNYRNGIFVMSNATRGGLIGQFAFMDLHGLPTTWLTTFVERLYAVTPQQVSEATRQHLDPKRMSVVVIGDMATVRKQLDAVKELPRIDAKP